jgi:hypothetical protein
MASDTLPAEPAANNPWAIETDRLARESGQSYTACRDVVILRWLKKGDVRPLAHLLLTGHRPGPKVLRYLAGMLHPDFAPVFIGFDGQPKTPDYQYRLTVTSTTGARGPRDNPENDLRDRLIAAQVERKRAEGSTREEALVAVAELCGGRSRIEMVRKAYSRHYTGQKRGK